MLYYNTILTISYNLLQLWFLCCFCTQFFLNQKLWFLYISRNFQRFVFTSIGRFFSIEIFKRFVRDFGICHMITCVIMLYVTMLVVHLPGSITAHDGGPAGVLWDKEPLPGQGGCQPLTLSGQQVHIQHHLQWRPNPTTCGKQKQQHLPLLHRNFLISISFGLAWIFGLACKIWKRSQFRQRWRN